MATNFRYTNVSILSKYFNRASDYDNKRTMYGWQSGLGDWYDSTLDIFYAGDVGYIENVFVNGTKVDKITYNTTETTKLDGALNTSAALFYVDDSHGLEADDIVKIDNEYIRVTSVSSDTIACASAGTNRGLFGSSAQHHANDASVYLIIDASTDVGDASSADPDALSFVYDPDLDLCLLIAGGGLGGDINTNLVEGGAAFTSFMEQILVDASLELHNYLDARYSTPLEKSKQVDVDTNPVGIAEEYDPIIIKSVCYIAAANLIRAKEGQSEEADYYHALVTNAERTGLIDKLNDGIYKLSNEVDANDKKGKILRRSVTSGGLDLVELAGEYTGGHYDLLKVDIDTGGVYGTATFTVSYLSDDKLEGATTSAKIITGGLQEIHQGIFGRFMGNSADADDFWHIEVYGSHRKQTNKSNATIEMVR